MNKIMDLNEVMAATKMGRSSILRMVKEGKFPRQRHTAAKKKVWVTSEVEAWLDRIINDQNLEAKTCAD